MPFIITPAGKLVGQLPTMDQEEHDRIKRTNAIVNAKADKIEAELAKKRARKLAALPDENQRRQACVAGLQRCSKKAEREDNPGKVEKLAQYALDAAAALEKYDEATKALGAKRPDPMGNAIDLAARELRDKLPRCFPTDQDAIQFARHLPMITATREAACLADEFAKIARQRTAADRSFWQAVQFGGRLALQSLDEDGNIRKLVELGL